MLLKLLQHHQITSFCSSIATALTPFPFLSEEGTLLNICKSADPKCPFDGQACMGRVAKMTCLLSAGVDLLLCVQYEDETSSANYGSSNHGTPSRRHTEGAHGEAVQQQIGTGQGCMYQLQSAGSMQDPGDFGDFGDDASRKDSAAADDLRELAAKGVCAPLWRTSQPVQPV